MVFLEVNGIIFRPFGVFNRYRCGHAASSKNNFFQNKNIMERN